MIYVIGKRHHTREKWFKCIDTNTETIFDGLAKDICRWILIRRIDIVNVKIVNKETVIEGWFNGIHNAIGKTATETSTGAHYVLLCKLDKNKYKIVDYNGKVSYIGKRQLYKHTWNGVVANCKIEDEKIISVGTYDIIENTEFNKHIAEKYNIYIAKTNLLGHNMSFDYTIEGSKVKLVQYTGTSKTVIIPKFITTIMNRAFSDCKTETITLDRGLNHIGGYAFKGCNITQITIPDTVELICPWAFYSNRSLINTEGEYTQKIKLMSNKTKVIDWKFEVD